jgi:hypothetical protein
MSAISMSRERHRNAKVFATGDNDRKIAPPFEEGRRDSPEIRLPASSGIVPVWEEVSMLSDLNDLNVSGDGVILGSRSLGAEFRSSGAGGDV